MRRRFRRCFHFRISFKVPRRAHGNGNAKTRVWERRRKGGSETKEQRRQSETRKRQNRAAARYRGGTSRRGLKNILCFFMRRYLRATINDEICNPAWFSARLARALLWIIHVRIAFPAFATTGLRARSIRECSPFFFPPSRLVYKPRTRSLTFSPRDLTDLRVFSDNLMFHDRFVLALKIGVWLRSRSRRKEENYLQIVIYPIAMFVCVYVCVCMRYFEYLFLIFFSMSVLLPTRYALFRVYLGLQLLISIDIPFESIYRIKRMMHFSAKCRRGSLIYTVQRIDYAICSVSLEAISDIWKVEIRSSYLAAKIDTKVRSAGRCYIAVRDSRAFLVALFIWPPR